MLFHNIWLILALFVIIFVVTLVLIIVFRSRFGDNPKWKETVRSKLRSLEVQNLDLNNQVIQLDKLLEFALQSKFRSKESLGSLLKKNKKKFEKRDLDQIWQAHKVRNKIAHDIDFAANSKDLREAVEILKRQCKKVSN